MPPQQEQIQMYAWENLTQYQARKAILFTEQAHHCLHKPTSRGKHAPYFDDALKG